VELGSSSELDRVVSARFPSPVRFAHARRIVPRLGSASPGVLAPVETPLRRVPLFARTATRAVREDEGRQAFAGAVLRVLAPLDGSGCARGTTRTLAELAVTPWRPDASRPYYMPLASLWSCPTELSLPEEPYLLSQAIASLRVRIRPPPAWCERALHGRFLCRASSLPLIHPEADKTHEP